MCSEYSFNIQLPMLFSAFSLKSKRKHKFASTGTHKCDYFVIVTFLRNSAYTIV